MAVLHANKAFVIAMLQLGTDCGVKAIWEGNHFSAWRIAKALWLDEIYDIFKLYGSGEGNQMQESETGEDGMNRTQRQFKEYFEEEERRKEEEAKQEREEEERKKKLEELKAKETHLGLRPFLR